MTDRGRTPTNDELGKLLRRGDPAADGSEPGPDEIARLRREVMAAADSPSLRPMWRPVLAVTSLLLVAAVGWLLLREPAPGPEIEPSLEPVTSPHESVVSNETPAEIPLETVTHAPPVEPERPTARPEVLVATVPESAAVRDSSRTVRFTTPNGTRIVWILDPNLDI